jgi:ABC-type glutathione transport system ATPase component
MTPLLQLQGLRLGFGEDPDVVRGVSFSLEAGQSLGLLGASGSGKSLSALAILGLLPSACQWRGGRVLLEGQDLAGLGAEARRALCGAAIGLVFQEPFTALNPLLRVGEQLAEGLRLHRGLDRASADREAAAWLEKVGLTPGPSRARQYPHQFSGGMRQRALLAMALACGPRLLICDEPTTALDATVQAQMLELLRRLQKELGFALLIISHDLAVIRAVAPRAVVMEAGEVVETGDVDSILLNPHSGAARRLMDAYAVLQSGGANEVNGG